MQALRAQVKNGRLILDEPTDRAEGDLVDLIPLDEMDDEMDDEERARLDACLERGMAQYRAGQCVPWEEVMAKLRGKHEA